MATDIVDKQLGAARKARWNKAFSGEDVCPAEGETLEDVNRKATIVIEHLIQVCRSAFRRRSQRSLTLSTYSTFRQVTLATQCSIGTSTSSGTSSACHCCGWNHESVSPQVFAFPHPFELSSTSYTLTGTNDFSTSFTKLIWTDVARSTHLWAIAGTRVN